MKRSLILSLLLIFSLTSLSFAETIKISGGQTAATGVLRDAKIGSEPVNLPSQGEITKVEGGYAGFWINKAGPWGGETKVADFSRPSEAIGYFLEAGTYTVYPNIPEEANSASVTIYVELGGEEKEIGRSISVPPQVLRKIKDTLTGEGLKIKDIRIDTANIVIAYLQSTTSSDEEVLGTWTYIMGIATENIASLNEVIIVCNYDDGEIMQATAAATNIDAYFSKGKSLKDFLSSITVEPLTKGPALIELGDVIDKIKSKIKSLPKDVVVGVPSWAWSYVKWKGGAIPPAFTEVTDIKIGRGKTAYVLVDARLGGYSARWISGDIDRVRKGFKRLGYRVVNLRLTEENLKRLFIDRKDPNFKAFAFFGHLREPGFITEKQEWQGADIFEEELHKLMKKYAEQGQRGEEMWKRAREEACLNLDIAYFHTCKSFTGLYKEFADFLLRRGGIYYGYSGILYGAEIPEEFYVRPEKEIALEYQLPFTEEEINSMAEDCVKEAEGKLGIQLSSFTKQSIAGRVRGGVYLYRTYDFSHYWTSLPSTKRGGSYEETYEKKGKELDEIWKRHLESQRQKSSELYYYGDATCEQAKSTGIPFSSCAEWIAYRGDFVRYHNDRAEKELEQLTKGDEGLSDKWQMMVFEQGDSPEARQIFIEANKYFAYRQSWKEKEAFIHLEFECIHRPYGEKLCEKEALERRKKSPGPQRRIIRER